jgi:hypothetical protein
MEDSQDITRLLLDWQNGKKDALDKLTPLVYQELHCVAEAIRCCAVWSAIPVTPRSVGGESLNIVEATI